MRARAIVVVVALGCAPARRPPPAMQVSSVLSGGDEAGFAHALAPRRFVFPDDHGPHPDFRSEWWYLTGNLRAGARRFGYQLTIFRQALAPEAPPRASAWASRHVYLGHLAITDGQGHFIAVERISRDGLALAGAQAAPFRVWLDDWQMQGIFPLTLAARSADGAIALSLDAGRGPILQGESGLSRKGPQPGNASYYYSFTRLPTRGRLTVGGQSFEVTGSSWLDREWSTSALGPELAGWDWLALQLSDGRDLMIYRLRRKDGSAAPESRATLIDAHARTRLFGPDAFSLTPERWWTSAQSGGRYPIAMTVRLPSESITLRVQPLVDDQELRLSFRYWEGAISADGGGLGGEGYLELTGYAP